MVDKSIDDVCCLVFWDKDAFSLDMLPSQNIIYTQLYLSDSAWSIKLIFEDSPKDQGFECIAFASFLVEKAPKHLLSKGFIFDLRDGARIVGHCEII